MKELEDREDELQLQIQQHKIKEDEFLNVRVAQITARHGKEKEELEAIIAVQLKSVENFQRELDKLKDQLHRKDVEIADLEVLFVNHIQRTLHVDDITLHM